MKNFALFIFGSILFVPVIAWLGTRIICDIRFDQYCSGYLENAAHANQIDQALPQMQQALSYLESHGMTEGYTSIIYRTQDENVGFWYSNLKSATAELQKVASDPNASPLEQSNVLLKLDNTLKTTAGTIKSPEGIEIAPRNTAFVAWAIFGIV